MLWTNIKRICKSGFVGFWRNGFISFAAILIMTVTLCTVAMVMLVGAVLNSSLTELKNKVDINVYFVTSAPEDQVLALKKSLEQMPAVQSVEYVSRDQAIANFRKRHENDQLTIQALDELSDNPLGAILNVRAKDPTQYASIASFLENGTALQNGQLAIIDKVNFSQNKVVIDKLSRIIDSSQTLGFAVTIILIIVSIIITLNTIRLAIYTAKDEVAVMRLVGASNAYTQGPFLVEGVMYGVVAALITLVLFYPLTFWLGPYTEGFFGSINVFTYYIQNFGQMFLVIFFGGIVLGAVASFIAIKRYLKV